MVNIRNHAGGTATFLIFFFIVFCIGIFYFAGYDLTKVPGIISSIIHYFVELYRALEAFEIIGELRYAVEGCVNANSGQYYPCFPSRTIDAVNGREGNHFEYAWRHLGRQDFEITAIRNRYEGGHPDNRIYIRQKNGKIRRGGKGIYFFIF